MILNMKKRFGFVPLGEPLTFYNFQDLDECLVAVLIRGETKVNLCRWGYKYDRKEEKAYQGFWNLDGSPLPFMSWNTYGTYWQAYRVNLPNDLRDIAVSDGVMV